MSEVVCEKCGGNEKVSTFEIRLAEKPGRRASKYLRTLCRPCVKTTIRRTRPNECEQIISFFEHFVWNQAEPMLRQHIRPLDLCA